jgi:homoserine dehydrogenase
MSDIIEMALGNARRTFEQLCVLPDQTPPARYRPVGQSVSAHYLRMRLLDRPGGIGKVATVLGAAGISIATIVQHEPPSGGSATAVPVIVTTHPAKQQTVRTATESIGRLDVVAGEPVCIPVFDGLDE